MRIATVFALAALTATLPALPAAAKTQHRYEYNGQYYNSLEQCRAEKSRAKKRGTIVGAATAGLGAALLGGNLGTSALIAGGGAVVGHELGSSSKKC